MYQVKDAMSREVVSLRPDITIDAAIRTLLKHKISRATVMENGRLLGIISQFQLLEVIYDPKIKSLCVKDLMTRTVLTIKEDDTLGTAANLLIVHRIHRLPVVCGESVVGIISRSDLLDYVAKVGEIDEFFAKLKSTSPTTAATEPLICA